MANAVNPIPEGFHTVTPHLIVKDAAKALEFYSRAFGAEETMRMTSPDGGKVMHAEMRIGDSHLFIADEYPDFGAVGPQALGGSPVTIHLYVRDANAAYQRALDAGARATMPLADQFWGDRYGKLVDPYGHHWSIAQHIEDVAPEDCARRAAKEFGCS